MRAIFATSPFLLVALVACNRDVSIEGKGGGPSASTWSPTGTSRSSSGLPTYSFSTGGYGGGRPTYSFSPTSNPSTSRTTGSATSGAWSTGSSSSAIYSTSRTATASLSSTVSGGCPAFPDNVVYVNSVTTVGADGPCCGRQTTPGSTGPCLTLSHALTVFRQSDMTVIITADANGDVNPAEMYPIQLDRGVSVMSSGEMNGSPPKPNAFFPGVPGKNVFEVPEGATATTLGGVVVGVDSKGVSGGARDGVYVGPNAVLAEILNSTIQSVVNGVHVDGGNASQLTNSTIQTVSAGILCRSDTVPTAASLVNASVTTILGASQYDVFAGNGCNAMLGGMTLGPQGPCPSPKTDSFGVYAEGSAVVNVDGCTINCMNQDAVSLHRNAALTTNSPSVDIQGGTMTHSGCAGLYAEVGKITSAGAILTKNHFGAIQRSALSSTSLSDALLVLQPGNQLFCNSMAEPGACCTTGSCPAGADVWNNSGLPIDATNDVWDVAPLGSCACDSQLKNCTCSGWAVAMNAVPPDGVEVLSTPYSGTTAGPPVTTTNAIAASPATGCK